MDMIKPLWFFCVFELLFSSYSSHQHTFLRKKTDDGTTTFPTDFLFGTASSSYQYEGAYLTGGKGLSNWDVFTHIPGHVDDGKNGDVSVDHYHLYKEDLDLMEDLGVNSYRFSLSWARILPKGRFGEVNMVGIHHYSRMIDSMISRGIEPFVTLTHYDIPQELEDRYDGWMSPQIREDFEHYADICFKHFGDRVKLWATFNEPNIQVVYGYRKGIYSPGHCSQPYGDCTRGNSNTEPFIAAHNIIRSHHAAVYIYRTKYHREQKGNIGIVMNTVWYEPVAESAVEKLAVERAQAFFLTWFLDPIVFGKYPKEMVDILGDDLPEFSSDDLKRFNNGLDFIGINHYTSVYIKDCMLSECEPGKGGSRAEGFVSTYALKDGLPLGETTGISWLYVYPQGMENILMYITERYDHIPMYVTENGYGDNTTEVLLNDHRRVKFMSSYLESLIQAMTKGANVKGYFVWSLLDNFEWIHGYTIRFGLHHVDLVMQNRTPRSSASWYKNFISHHKGSDRLDREDAYV